MSQLTTVHLERVAQRYVDRWFPDRAGVIGRLGDVTVRVDETFCRQVADHFAAQPQYAWSPDLARRYALLQAESMRQYEAMVDAGIRVEPWLHAGQPYDGSRHLCDSVRETGTVYVYLTRDGHGPGPAAGFAPADEHPMRGPSGVRRCGVELSHNDILRAVHDVFGHVMFGHSMGPTGEFRATFCHLAMYSDDVHPVLFSEQISQICWFFYGPYRRVPPAERPYAEQKVFACPQWFVDRFKASFGEESR
jgi:hypothetical protein